MKEHYPVIIEQDSEGVFIVECPLFKGCRSYGYSVDEAMKNIREAIEACIEDTTEVEDRTTFVGVRDLEIGAP